MGNRTPQSVINTMRTKGRTLHLQYRWFGEEWRLSDGTVVDPDVARIVTRNKTSPVSATPCSTARPHRRGVTLKSRKSSAASNGGFLAN